MEHVGFQYRQDIEKQLGTSLQSPETELPPGIEASLSVLMAQASDSLTALNKSKAAQQRAMEQAQDPVVQMQQQELALRQQELAIKQQEVQNKAQIAQEEIASRERIVQQEAQGRERIAMLSNENKLMLQEKKDVTDGVLAGVELAQSQARMHSDAFHKGLDHAGQAVKTDR
jgi:hypothetical protein